jgi:hypothetical protein
MDMFVIELKRGYSKATLWDCLDAARAATQQFEKFLLQASQSQDDSKASKFWMLITKRDQRQPVVTIPNDALLAFSTHHKLTYRALRGVPHMTYRGDNGGYIHSFRYADFFAAVKPAAIKAFIKKECDDAI